LRENRSALRRPANFPDAFTFIGAAEHNRFPVRDGRATNSNCCKRNLPAGDVSKAASIIFYINQKASRRFTKVRLGHPDLHPERRRCSLNEILLRGQQRRGSPMTRPNQFFPSLLRQFLGVQSTKLRIKFSSWSGQNGRVKRKNSAGFGNDYTKIVEPFRLSGSLPI